MEQSDTRKDYRKYTATALAFVSLACAAFSWLIDNLMIWIPGVLAIPALILGLLSFHRLTAKVGIAVLAATVFSSTSIRIYLDYRCASLSAQSRDHLRTIWVGLDAYEHVNNRLPPPAICNPGGEPLLSWRVAILPYIGQRNLYGSFNLAEPWDSPHNLRLLVHMPACYHCPRFPPECQAHGYTFYQVFTGPTTLLEKEESLSRLRLSSGYADERAMLVVEAGDPVPWTAPRELMYEPHGPLPPLGGPSRHDFHALFASGRIHRVPAATHHHDIRSWIVSPRHSPATVKLPRGMSFRLEDNQDRPTCTPSALP